MRSLASVSSLHRARDAAAQQQRDERGGEHGQQQRQHDAPALHERRGVDRAHRPRDHDRADQLAAVAEAARRGERRGAVGELQVERLRAASSPVLPSSFQLRRASVPFGALPKRTSSIGGCRPERPTK